jgi:S1-C subfamily serine protease
LHPTPPRLSQTRRRVLARTLTPLAKAAPDSGEAVAVISHPGLGGQALEYSLTTGVVSNPRQRLEGVEYLQTNAAVNPGSSGAPVFDSHGAVVGMVVLKGDIEGAAFAVPASRLAEFLTSCTHSAASKPSRGRAAGE